MPEIIKILIVEDTESDIQSYKDSIRTVNLELSPHYEIQAEFQSSKKDGLEAIQRLRDELNGAFIDLKLSSGTTIDVNEGNDVVEAVYGKLRFPVLVLTNTPNAINPGFKKSVFLDVITKTDVQYNDVLLKFVEIHKTGITKILGGKGRIEVMLSDIFWKNISLSLGDWLEVKDSEKHLLRYTLTHLQEHLEITDDGNEFDDVFPVENYIKPGIKKYFFTGDIINKIGDKGKRFVILTPACDMAPHGPQHTPKATHIILSEVEKFEDTPLQTFIKKAKKEITNDEDTTNRLKAEESIKKLIINNGDLKYYYLPDSSIVKGGLINFQKLTSVKASEISGYEKEATIASQFVKDIIAKFSFYYSRQGSPDFDYDSLLKKHLS
jgi:hypothetical protein